MSPFPLPWWQVRKLVHGAPGWTNTWEALLLLSGHFILNPTFSFSIDFMPQINGQLFFWAYFRLIQLEWLPFLPSPKGAPDYNWLAQQNPNRYRCEFMYHTITQGRKPEPRQMNKKTKIQRNGYNHKGRTFKGSGHISQRITGLEQTSIEHGPHLTRTHKNVMMLIIIIKELKVVSQMFHFCACTHAHVWIHVHEETTGSVAS